jgi:hypothetical protein
MKHKQWISRQMRLGAAFLAAGLLVGAAGIVLERAGSPPGFDARIITGIGILLLGAGAGTLGRYIAARQDPTAARRIITEEQDERSRHLRAVSGNRAFAVSMVIAYTGLMWISFASNGQVPAPSLDVLWYYLTGAVVAPGGVYLASLLYEHRRN